MTIDTDFSVAANGDIRYTGTGTNYTVIAFHRWLGDLMDNAQASGDDILDITDATASERSTDNIITLNSPYNIDDIAAEHLYDGSIIQNNGDTIYDGILVYSNAGTYLQVLQSGKRLSPNFWTTGLNADAANGISHRFMVKVRSGGSDIDGRRLVGQTREFNSTYSEFKINGTSRGNNVLALTFATDLNNQTSASTVAGWTTIVNNTVGYALLDVNNDTVNEPYYSEWTRDTFTMNQLYERAKWLTRRSTTEDSNADTGTDYIVGNGTLQGQSQAFANGGMNQFLTRCHFRLKKVGSPIGNLVAKLYAITGAFGSAAIPTGAALATSDNLNVATLTTSYLEKELTFGVPYEMVANTDYAITVEYTGGDGSNYVQVEGASSGTHAGNKASETAAVWTAQAGEDLWFQVYDSPNMYGIPGEEFRGVTHQVALTTPRTGTFSAVEPVSWTGGTGLMLAIDSTTAGTKMWIQILTGVAPTTGLTITGTSSSATATSTGTAVERVLSQPFIGASTGSALIGSYGLGVATSDLSASDKLTDLDNSLETPPNNVTFTVNGLSVGDRVLVGPDSSGLQKNQLTLATTLSGIGETAIVVGSAIPSDTPSSGTVRVQLDSGIYRLVSYTSFAASTFTIASTDFSSDNATSGNNVFISYIDKAATSTSESFTVVFNSSRSLFVRVRNGGGSPIKTFETTGTLGAGGGSATAIRTADA